VAGGICNGAGTEGQCKCPLNCAAGASCKYYYPDTDHDGFGDANAFNKATQTCPTCQVGCSNVAPQAGYVDDNTDCDDRDPNVHPGQGSFFGVKSLGVGTWDYNCDGIIEKETPSFPNGCEYCGFNDAGTCGLTSPTCPAVEQAAFNCGPRPFCIFRPPFPPHCTFTGCFTAVTTGFAGEPARPNPDPNPAFDCGVTKTATNCGSCSVAGGYPANTYTSVVQQCR
jgi:hypothetical protein